MTLKGGTSQACAACKYQRRKCTPECPLAPYFPPDQPKMFQNVHKLFGVKKIQKLLQVLPAINQNEAMSSIIYQANIRDRYPVYGCCEVIHLLKNEIRKCEEELYAVHAMLAMYRQQEDQQMSTDVPVLADVDATSQLQLGMTPSINNGQTFYLQTPVTAEYYNTDDVFPITQNICSNNPYNIYNDKNIKTSGVNPLATVNSQEPTTQDEFQHYEEMRPYFDLIDDQQSYIDPNEAYESSPESYGRNTTQFEEVAENDLKTAAACFSLTSVRVN